MLSTHTTLIILNQIAQSIIDIETGEKWFSAFDANDQKDILGKLMYCVYQSHPKEIERKYAVLESGLRPTFTPCVLLVQKYNIQCQLKQICSLPNEENKKSFRLLITLLSISDKRRRLECGDSCNHWWHQDLKQYKQLI
jgi:hypothetical protein